LLSCNKSTNDKYKSILDPAFEEVGKVLDKYIKEKKIPGAVALVSHKDQLVVHKAFGTKIPETGIQFQNQDIFRIASMTKPITSVAAMMLFEEGKFELNDPVSMYIPVFKSMQILEKINPEDSSFIASPAQNEMTIKQLFTYTSGLYYGYDIDSLSMIFNKAGITEGFEERNILLKDNINKLGRLPLLHEPGERYHYGLEMDVQGRLLEIWSGLPLDEFFRERIFVPLGMNDTHFYLPEEKSKRLVPVYMSGEEGYEATDYPLVDYPVKGAKKYLSGGADLSSTALDYYLFCQMMLNKGILNGHRLLQEETVDLMSTTHLETGDNDMGLGFGLLSAKTEVDLARSVGSLTWGGFFCTLFWIDPAEEVIGILLLQMYPFNEWSIQEEFEQAVYRSVNRIKSKNE
jgi:CubicO group peptidase (beta-lactamase class C family)